MARIIKRYSNRKCYDTENSKYINLNEIEQMIKDEVDVKIIDNETKEDLTTIYLAKIIMNQGKKGREFLPSEYLKELIQRKGVSMKDFLQKPFQFGQHFVTQSKSELEKFFKSFIEKGLISFEDAKSMINDIVREGWRSEKVLDRKIEEKLAAEIEKLDIPSKEAMESLDRKVTDLIEMVKKIS
jgi:polyhydroxyalkanoate synthesis repressor PhaR